MVQGWTLHTPISAHNHDEYGVPLSTYHSISEHLWLQQPRPLSSRTLMGLDMELEPAEVTGSSGLNLSLLYQRNKLWSWVLGSQALQLLSPFTGCNSSSLHSHDLLYSLWWATVWFMHQAWSSVPGSGAGRVTSNRWNLTDPFQKWMEGTRCNWSGWWSQNSVLRNSRVRGCIHEHPFEKFRHF